MLQANADCFSGICTCWPQTMWDDVLLRLHTLHSWGLSGRHSRRQDNCRTWQDMRRCGKENKITFGYKANERQPHSSIVSSYLPTKTLYHSNMCRCFCQFVEAFLRGPIIINIKLYIFIMFDIDIWSHGNFKMMWCPGFEKLKQGLKIVPSVSETRSKFTQYDTETFHHAWRVNAK